MSETRIALIGIIVEERSSAEKINSILHDYSSIIQGRMGIPCESYGVSVISVVVAAPQTEISTLSGKIGALSGVTARVIYSKTRE